MSQPKMSLSEFDALFEEVSNWGRWGPHDQRGTLNLITPKVIQRAVASVRSGEQFSLAMPLSLKGPQDGTAMPGRVNPIRTMLTINMPLGATPEACAANDDFLVMPVQAGTHWDALSHVSHRGRMYNGIPATEVEARGAMKLGIESAGPITSRAVLFDIARHEGVDVLPPGYQINEEILASVEAAQVSPLASGDILLIRTGLGQYLQGGDYEAYRNRRPVPGLVCSALRFVRARDVAAVATDTLPFELLPAPVEEVVLPVHILSLIAMGLFQGQNFLLEELARACAQDRRYEMLLAATPEPLIGSPGGMVAPVAIR